MWGPWQALERDVARLLIANGFDDVRLVGGAGDHGADVLGVQNSELWVWQCKHTTGSPPPRSAIGEVVDAARFYGAKRLVVATSRPPIDSFYQEKARFEGQGWKIQLADPKILLDLMERTPEYPKARKTLRNYQELASTRFREALLDTGRAQIILATGLGKTVVMAEAVADLLRDDLIKQGRVLVIAHTRELVNQLHRNFWYQLPRWVPTHQLSEGETPTYWDGITFATVQSVNARLKSLPEFGLILVDEAHHIGAEMFLRAIDELDPPMIGGVTATPWRGDNYDLDQILGRPLVRVGIAEGLQQGFLSEVDYRLYADNVDWKFVRKASKHKYSLSELNQKLILPTRDEQAVGIICETFRDHTRRSGVVFCRTIIHAKSFAAMLRHFGLRSESISSKTTPRDRDLLMSKFRAGELDVVTTVDLFNEGVDLPDVDLIAFMRVTHSRRIFVQQLGRGLRISPTKDRVIVLDFVSDLRRIAEVLDLDRMVRGEEVERLGLGGRLIHFSDVSAGGFLTEWMLDQASLVLREGDPQLEMPQFEFPKPASLGGVQ
jgi:superfamily II DNA or RNA helicase